MFLKPNNIENLNKLDFFSLKFSYFIGFILYKTKSYEFTIDQLSSHLIKITCLNSSKKYLNRLKHLNYFPND